MHCLETDDLEMPDIPIALTSSSTRMVRTPAIQASWITKTSAFSAVLRVRATREIRTGRELGDLQVERAEPSIQASVAIAIALGAAVARALVLTRADQAVDVGFHIVCNTLSATVRR